MHLYFSYFEIALISEPAHFYTQAKENLELALKVLELKHNNLKSLETSDEKILAELVEINELLVELRQRIIDLNESEVAYESFKRNKIVEAIKHGQVGLFEADALLLYKNW